MFAGFNLEGGNLPPSIILPSAATSGDLLLNRQSGADISSGHDTLDRKRSVSFAPTSSEGDDSNRIAIGMIVEIVHLHVLKLIILTIKQFLFLK